MYKSILITGAGSGLGEELSGVQGSQRRYHAGREVDPLTANARSPRKGWGR